MFICLIALLTVVLLYVSCVDKMIIQYIFFKFLAQQKVALFIIDFCPISMSHV